MTDDSAGFYSGADDDGADFDDAFFSSLEAGPDEDPSEAVAEDLVPDEALDLDGGDGVDEIFYEAESDGSFETEAADLDADDFPFDLGGEG